MGPLQFMSFGSTVVGKMVRINLQTRLVSAGLQPLSGEQFNHNMDEGRLDVVADYIWGNNHQNTKFDTKDFNHIDKSQVNTSVLPSPWTDKSEQEVEHDASCHLFTLHQWTWDNDFSKI